MARTAVAKKEKTPVIPLSERISGIRVDVDWANVDLAQGRMLYSELKREFEKAGKIMNVRENPQEDKYICFMSGKPGCCKDGIVHDGIPRFTDNSFINKKTGLIQVVKICSELCYHRYNDFRIKERRDRMRPDING